jgi:predicted nucleic acid-binding protein
MFKRPKKRVVIDTNVISSGIGDLERPQLDAVVVADLSREHIYTKEVDDELSNAGKRKSVCRHNPFFIYNIGVYRFIKRFHMVDNKIDHSNEPDNPAKNRDKKIFRAAVWAKADAIITLDKKFRRRTDGFMGMHLIRPDEYLKSKKSRNRVK